MNTYIFDIEGNDLLQGVSKIWYISFKNLESGQRFRFKPFAGEDGWIRIIENATKLIGHNITGYDLPVLLKLYNVRPNSRCKIVDTLILSRVLDYRRFGDAGHSLAVWGEALGHPKIDFNDFSQFSEEMAAYCDNDVDVNTEIYLELIKEYTAKRTQKLKLYIDYEHSVAKWCAEAELHGWPFDVEKALELEKTLSQDIAHAEQELTHKLGLKIVAVDKNLGVIVNKSPKFLKNGCYDAHTCNWFGIEPESGAFEEDRMVVGPFTRIRVDDLKLSSVSDVKLFLYRNGWQPTTWNHTRSKSGKMERSSPKITDDSLEFLGGDGKLYSDYAVTKSRYGILKGWLEAMRNGKVHGSCKTIGTPSMRASHNVIVNIPTADSKWGKEMRSLFICPPGWKIIGCDSASNQARGLAHYLGSAEYTSQLLEGDIHAYNAEVLTGVLKGMNIEHEVPRSVAKRILYAFLFGASGAKLWMYIFGVSDTAKGNSLKAGFLKAVPGFKRLVDGLNATFQATIERGIADQGFIQSLADNRIYVDSPHKLLVYLLQACEKITCSAAIHYTMKNLEAEGIPYIPLIMYHDEEEFMVPEEFAERAAEIGKNAYRDGPKDFGIMIMDGGSKIGDNWYEVH